MMIRLYSARFRVGSLQGRLEKPSELQFIFRLQKSSPLEKMDTPLKSLSSLNSNP